MHVPLTLRLRTASAIT